MQMQAQSNILWALATLGSRPPTPWLYEFLWSVARTAHQDRRRLRQRYRLLLLPLLQRHSVLLAKEQARMRKPQPLQQAQRQRYAQRVQEAQEQLLLTQQRLRPLQRGFRRGCAGLAQSAAISLWATAKLGYDPGGKWVNFMLRMLGPGATTKHREPTIATTIPAAADSGDLLYNEGVTTPAASSRDDNVGESVGMVIAKKQSVGDSEGAGGGGDRLGQMRAGGGYIREYVGDQSVGERDGSGAANVKKDAEDVGSDDDDSDADEARDAGWLLTPLMKRQVRYACFLLGYSSRIHT